MPLWLWQRRPCGVSFQLIEILWTNQSGFQFLKIALIGWIHAERSPDRFAMGICRRLLAWRYDPRIGSGHILGTSSRHQRDRAMRNDVDMFSLVNLPHRNYAWG